MTGPRFFLQPAEFLVVRIPDPLRKREVIVENLQCLAGDRLYRQPWALVLNSPHDIQPLEEPEYRNAFSCFFSFTGAVLRISCRRLTR